MNASLPARPFNKRAFAASMAALTGATLPLSGWFCHVYQFAPMTVARHAWMAVHVATAILFVVFAGWHVVMNRKAIGAYLRGAGANAPGFSREARLAAVIFAFVLFVAAGHAFLPHAARAVAIVALW
jgi:FtsH-binding integral membrane protein